MQQIYKKKKEKISVSIKNLYTKSKKYLEIAQLGEMIWMSNLAQSCGKMFYEFKNNV